MRKSALLFLAAIILFAMPFGFALFSHTIERTVNSDSLFMWDWQLDRGFVLMPAPTLFLNLLLGVCLVAGIVALYQYTQHQDVTHPPKAIVPSRWTKRVGILMMIVTTFGFVGYTALAFPRMNTSFAGRNVRLPVLHNLIVAVLIVLGASGLLMMYQAHRRESRLQLAVGFFVVLFMFVLLEMFFRLTLSWMR